ncbi:glycoside hydrolase family 31 protein [Stetteria hydrogenophila]
MPVSFEALSSRVLRVTVGDAPAGGSFAVLREPGGGGGGAWRVSREGGGFVVEWRGLRLTVVGEPGREGGFTVLRHSLDEGDHVYGLGERYSLSIDRRGGWFHVWNSPQPCHLPSGDPMYLSIPFYMVARPGKWYGVLVDYPGYIHVDLGAGDPGWAVVRVEAGGFRAYIIAGESPAEVLDAYTSMTGRPFMPPRWALGYHQSRYSYASQREVLEVVEGCRRHGIPCDAVYLDIDYMDGYRVFTWDRRRFPDPEGLARRLHEMGVRLVAIVDVGVKAEAGYWVYDEGLRIDAFLRTSRGDLFRGGVWPGLCVFPDFLRSSVREYWARLIRGLLNTGVDGVWLDMNEPSIFYMEPALREVVGELARLLREGRVDEAGWKLYWEALPRVTTRGYKWRGPAEIDAVHTSDEGRRIPHRAIHNAYPLLECEATRTGFTQRDPEGRWFILSRSGFAGIQRCAAVWTGDNESDWGHMAASIPMILNLGLSGVPFAGADVGGFAGDAEPELLVRWMQLGAFYPFYRNHSSKGTRRQEPWVFGEPYTSIAREAVRLRYRLLPYIYTLFAESHRTGIPVARPLFLEFPRDEASYTVSDEFMLGPSLLVAPVLSPGARARAVYLPEVEWLDYHTCEARGPGWVLAEAPLERIPLYLREDSAVLTTDPVESTAVKPGVLRVEAFLKGEASARLYDDDGETLAYQRGEYFEAEFRLERRGARVRVEVEVLNDGYKPGYEWVEFRILNGRGLDSLEVNGARAAMVREGRAAAARIPASLLWGTRG